MEKKIINSRLPIFTGFYGTLFECDCEEQEVENYNEENNLNVPYNDFIFNYEDYHTRVAKDCVNSIKGELQSLFDIDLVFDELDSPRFYNYRNDLIMVNYSIDLTNFIKIRSYLMNNEEDFINFINERFTSRSGFISFYDTDIFKWYNKYLDWEKLDHNIFGVVLEFILLNEEYTEEDLLEDTREERQYISHTTNEFEL